MANKVDDMHNKVEDIHKYLVRSKRSATLLPSDAAVRQEIPLKPEVFYGRDDFVQDIVRLLLQEETSRVCILGPGGMGKTSVSLAVVESALIEERFPGGNLVWVPCIEATSATLLLEILYTQLQVPGDKQVTLDKIISELDASKKPHLILLDNFETPWNAPGGTQKQVGDILRRLAKLSHVAILVTMRGRYPPCDKAIKWQSKDIKATDEAACLRIYHEINPGSENDPDVARLLATLAHMPFAVTLMAKLGVEGQSTAKELLDAWSESGPDILSNDPEQSMNRSIGLSVESNLVKRNPDATILLTILSLLPAGTTKENLHWWAPTLKTSMIPPAIANLSQAALLVENTRENSASPVLFVVPVVQSLSDSPFMQANVSLAFGKVLFSANKDAQAWKQIEIALMKASYIGDRLSIARALQYMGYGYLRRGDYQNAYGAYEAAAERYLGTVDAHIVELCKDNMARIERKQKNPNAVVGFYRPGMDIDKTLFYPPVQVSTSELPISSS
jgi:hypothetical protein